MSFGSAPLASTTFQTPTGGGTGLSNANGGSAIDATGAKLLTLNVGASNTNSSDPIVVTDNYGNTWQLAVGYFVATTFTSAIYYAKNPTVGTGHVVTVTCAAITYATCIFDAWADGDPTSPLDVTSSGVSSASVVHPGPITPSNANSLVIMAFGYGTGSNPFFFSCSDASTWNANLAFANINTLGNAYSGGRSYLIQTTIAAEDPDWNNVESAASAVIAVFKPSTGGGGGGAILSRYYFQQHIARAA